MGIDAVIRTLQQKTAGIREAQLIFIQQPTITGFGTTGGFTFQVQDRGGHTTRDFYQVTQNFLTTLSDRPEIDYATTSFNPNFPQYELDVDVAKCKEAGLVVGDILGAMQTFYGSLYVSNFNEFGKLYRVIMQADTNYRASPEGLNRIQVRTITGTMAPITEFISLKRIYGPESVTRFNLFSSMSVNGAPNADYSTGQALLAIEAVAAQTLPAGYGFEYSGISREEQKTGSQTIYVFLLYLAFV